MRRQAILVVAALPFAVGGCAGLSPGYRSPHCGPTATECRLTVVVRPNCQISIQPSEHYVVATRPGGVDMVWDISGATFAPNGINFSARPVKPQPTPPSNPAGVFSPPGLATATQVRSRNTTQRGYYYYAVNVVQGGSACPEYDPGIANQ